MPESLTFDIPSEILCDVFLYMDGLSIMEIKIICKRWKNIIENFGETLPLSPLKYQLLVNFAPYSESPGINFLTLNEENEWDNAINLSFSSFAEAKNAIFSSQKLLSSLELWLDPGSFAYLSRVSSLFQRPIYTKSLQVTLTNYFNFLDSIKEFFLRLIIPLENVFVNLLEQNLMNLFIRDPSQIPIQYSPVVRIRCCMSLDPEIVTLDHLVNFLFIENASFKVCQSISMPPVYATPYKGVLFKFVEKFFETPIPLACFKEIDIDISEEIWKNSPFHTKKLGETFSIKRPDNWVLNISVLSRIHSRGMRSVIFSVNKSAD